MKLRHVLATALAVAAVSITGSHEANATGLDRPEWAGLTIGWDANQKAVGGICTDKDSDDAARTCSINDFIKSGGKTASHNRSWKCKGHISGAMSTKGSVGVSWCKKTQKEADDEAMVGCKKGTGGADCKVVFQKLDKF